MDPLNKLLNLLSHVINICRMYSVYLTFDVAPKVVWLCNIRWVGALGVPKISEQIWNLKNSMLDGWCLHTDQCHTPWCLERLFIQHRFPCMFSGQFFQADSFLISQTSPGQFVRLILQNQTTAFGTMSKARYTKHDLSNWWLKTQNLQVY
jgi:hypothetical protein